MSGTKGKKVYFLVWGVLLLLLAMTVAVAYVPAGWFNVVIAIGIAAVKTTLIAAYFMHLRSSARVTWIAAGAGVVWLAILFTLTFGDYLTRIYLAQPVIWRP